MLKFQIDLVEWKMDIIAKKSMYHKYVPNIFYASLRKHLTSSLLKKRSTPIAINQSHSKRAGSRRNEEQHDRTPVTQRLLHILTSTSGWLIPENQEAALDTCTWSLTLDVGFAALTSYEEEEVKVYVKSQAHSKVRLAKSYQYRFSNIFGLKENIHKEKRNEEEKGKQNRGMRGFGPHFAQTGCVALCRINAYSSSYLHQLPGQMQPLEITGITQGILKSSWSSLVSLFPEVLRLGGINGSRYLSDSAPVDPRSNLSPIFFETIYGENQGCLSLLALQQSLSPLPSLLNWGRRALGHRRTSASWYELEMPDPWKKEFGGEKVSLIGRVLPLQEDCRVHSEAASDLLR
ncbi:hypothetical protein MG293_012642 [Ovis ammon polii]|uniref:Uncharacterized protein n=1 Tax=Ovis ammon polii TaxID=230172 RepID=A0AAD4U4E3_OVIAM|nr:hypothetical protein MG293_012642 [Ovis ammon polii]